MELIVRSGPDAGASVTVEGKLTIGREAEFRLTDPSVSRMHAALTPAQDGRAVLEDLDSSGGTMVNGSRILGPVSLVGGERIQIGANALELVVAAAPVAGSPTVIAPTPSPTVMQPAPTPSPFDPPTFAQPPAIPGGDSSHRPRRRSRSTTTGAAAGLRRNGTV